MGRIKTAMVKRAARGLLRKDSEIFTKDFENNKKMLGNQMPSKRVRNKIAGYISRLIKAKDKE